MLLHTEFPFFELTPPETPLILYPDQLQVRLYYLLSLIQIRPMNQIPEQSEEQKILCFRP